MISALILVLGVLQYVECQLRYEPPAAQHVHDENALPQQGHIPLQGQQGHIPQQGHSAPLHTQMPPIAGGPFGSGLPLPGIHRAAFHDRAHIEDQDHIRDHLGGVVKPQSEMNNEELQFHYFKIHDYDNNNKLDGIELISALTDYHKGDKQESEPKQISEAEIAELIDSIMNVDDVDNDGYITYAEFVRSQKING